jgi:hypothetical protein
MSMSALTEQKKLKLRAAKPQLTLTEEQWQDPVIRAAYAYGYLHACEENIQIAEEEGE